MDVLLQVKTYMNKRFIATALITAALYIILGILGLNLHPVEGYATFIWPASGIALAALILGGFAYAPVIAISSLIVYLTTGLSVPIAFGLAISNTLEAVIGVYILQMVGFDWTFRRIRDAVGFIFTALTIPLLSSAIGGLILILSGAVHYDAFGVLLTTRWIGHVLGILLVTPFLIRWLPRPFFRRTRTQYIEMALSFLVLVLLDYVVYWSGFRSIGGIPLFYFTFFPLCWIALRVGPRAMTLAILLNGAIAISGILYGNSASITPPSDATLLSLQLILGVLSALLLLFVSIEEERKEVRKELEHHVIELEKALEKIRLEDTAKNEFLAILAHELRNPLAPVLSAVELLKLQGVSTPPVTDLIEVIEGRVRTMGRLLDDLLDLSRITRGQFTLQKETVDLRTIVKHAIEEADTLIKSRQHKLAVSLPDEPLYLEGDPVRLEQIIVNLLTNAAKYTEPRGHIELTCNKDEQSVVISVKDNGIGIPPNMLTRIFEPFLQAARERSSSPGIGVGLAVTKNIVEMHNGTVIARSEGDTHGSEFIVRLPALVPAPLKSAPLPRRQKETPKLRVLVVDDNEAAAQGLQRLLEWKGHTVQVAHKGMDAVETIRQHEPHVAVLDIGLPDIDGFEVARRVREEIGLQTTLIALSGYGQEQDKQKAKEAGFDLYLTKPVGIAEIEAAFFEVLSRSAHRLRTLPLFS